MAKFHENTSFLKGAGTFDNFLDINKLPAIKATIADRAYQIEPKYDQRPDLLAFDMYGTTRLWWVFALRNVDTIKDPLRDFKQGLSILLPSKDTIENLKG
jgi:hypothetical protein